MTEAKEIIDEFNKMMEKSISKYPKTNFKIKHFKYKIVEVL